LYRDVQQQALLFTTVITVAASRFLFALLITHDLRMLGGLTLTAALLIALIRKQASKDLKGGRGSRHH